MRFGARRQSTLSRLVKGASMLSRRDARSWPGILGIVFSVAAAGCAGTGLVTGKQEPTAKGGQSETDATTTYAGGTHRIVVAYNDETGTESTIQYGQTTRKVLHGASLMGWSYSEDNGTSWKYGGKLTPPTGWAVLWGDPAMTTSRAHYAWSYMSNLAFPDAKFPSEGVDGYVYSAVGGACIARSTDGGVHFQIFQCVSNTDPIPGKPDSSKGHFYDGGSMAPGPQGEIFAAFIDIDSSQVDVWRSPDGSQPFVRLPPAFPSFYAGSHPRIRVGSDGTLFVMTIVKQQTNSVTPYLLAINRFRNGAWESPRLPVSFVEAYPDVTMNTSLLGAPLTVRTGPQYSFDLGTPSIDRDDSLRFMFTQRNGSGWLFVRGGICDLKSCGWFEGWTYGASQVTGKDGQRLDVFNPNVSAFPGFIGIGPRWQGAMMTRYGNATSTLNVTRGTLGYVNGTPFTIPVDILRDTPVCSDLRGYWGDYDGFLPVQVDGDNVRFMRFATDSTLGCTRRWQFLGANQHVRAVDYWF
jgi:hypothetical protein